MQPFPITVYRWGHQTPYKMMVELLSDTEGSHTFKVFAGKKYMILQRTSFPGGRNWEVKERNFEFQGQQSDINVTIDSICNLIDIQIVGPGKPLY